MDISVTAPEWKQHAARLREQYLNLYLEGHPSNLLQEPPQVVWGKTLKPSSEYQIRKFCFEGYPGVWVPALLYEPNSPLGSEGSTPAVLDVTGHEPRGMAAEHKQARCSNMAKRGILALSIEFLGHGEMTNLTMHNHQQFLDLMGQAGAGIFYLTMKRALDIIVDHELTDPKRIAMTGLSGGGWQTIVLSALDERVSLSVPVAGHMPAADRRDLSDVGDSEQLPADLCSIGDYDVISALVAPRPILFIFNRYDDCCFQPHKAASGTYEAACAIYDLLDVADYCKLHVGVDPGHNYGTSNRCAFYTFLNRHFVIDTPDDELPWKAEVYSEADLWVGLPSRRATFGSLAAEQLKICREQENQQPRQPRPADLNKLLRFNASTVTAATIKSSWVRVRDGQGVQVEEIALQVDGYWPLPGRLAVPDGTVGATIRIGEFSSDSPPDLETHAREIDRACLQLDLIGFGLLSAIHSYALLLRAISRPILGLQVAQLSASVIWAAERFGTPTHVEASGRVASVVALLAAARDTKPFASVSTDGLPYTIDNLIESQVSPEGPDYPLFCFGMRKLLDISDLLKLADSIPINDRRHGILTGVAL